MDFKQRLQRAAERGYQTRDAQAREEAERALGEEEYRRLHASYRRELTEHIERCLKQLADNFPGFSYETVVDDAGWGGAVRRDDLDLTRRRRDNLFSRLQVTVSSPNQYRVMELAAKGTIRNKENFTRTHFQKLHDIDLDTFRGLVEQWTLDYAEEFAAAPGAS
jgi:hypothetical protein